MRFFILIYALLFAGSLTAQERQYGNVILWEEAQQTVFILEEIKAGDSFELRKALRNHDIKNVVLASPGGSVFEALQIAGIIHDNKLRTYIPRGTDCASACAFLFFAGHERLADGRLGVHQAYSRNANVEEKVSQTQYVTQFTVSEIIGFLNEFGTPPFVYERMFEGLEMYFFDPVELMELNSGKFGLENDFLRIVTKYALAKINVDENKNEVAEPKLSDKQIVKLIQLRLNEIGCSAGPADGLWGKKTEAAARKFAKLAGIPFTGHRQLSPDFMEKLELAPLKYCPAPAKQKPAKFKKSQPVEVSNDNLSGPWSLIAECGGRLGTITGKAILTFKQKNGDFALYRVKYENNMSQTAHGFMNYDTIKNRAQANLAFDAYFTLNVSLKEKNGKWIGVDTNGCFVKAQQN